MMSEIKMAVDLSRIADALEITLNPTGHYQPGQTPVERIATALERIADHFDQLAAADEQQRRLSLQAEYERLATRAKNATSQFRAIDRRVMEEPPSPENEARLEAAESRAMEADANLEAFLMVHPEFRTATGAA